MNRLPRPPHPAQPFYGELSEKLLREAEQRLRSGQEVSALLFGHETCALAARLSGMGARVVIDTQPGRAPPLPRLRAVALPLTALPDLRPFPEAPFDLVLGQLAIHAQPYATTRQALRHMLVNMKIGGKMFLSTYGLHSDLGDAYPDSEKLVEQRFAELPAALADLYGLEGPLCLYSERNLITLLFEIGASIVHSATGPLGNVRSVGVRI